MKPEDRLAEGDKVKASSRLHRDIDALILLTDFEKPVKVPLRGVKQGVVCYTAGDAAGRGFGGYSKLQNCINSSKNLFRYGKWSCIVREERSSNFKE